MGMIIFAAIAALIFLIIIDPTLINNHHKEEVWIGAFILTLSLFIFLLMIQWLFSIFFINSHFTKTYEIKKSYSLVALSDNFYVINLRDSDDMVQYTAMYITPENKDGYKTITVSAKDSIVHPTTEGRPLLTYSEQKYTNKFINWYVLRSKSYQYDFYIPDGSINMVFNIDFN